MIFCTLFDSGYLSRGLAMYESLVQTHAEFHLYIFPFDQKALEVLEALQLKHVTLVPLKDFESQDLLDVKPSRTVGEYCWTCTPAIIEYVLKTFSAPSCTYIDADLYFFSNPLQLIQEMGDASVLLTLHRYSAAYDHSKRSGLYCVQFMRFVNNIEGLEALAWWKSQCLEWCYARVEPNRFGDQKYLDDWTERFKKVHVLQNPGGSLAPWNIQQYRLEKCNNKVHIYDNTGSRFQAVFYHFHQFKFMDLEHVDYGGYQLSAQVKKIIYKPYVQHLLRIESDLMNRFNCGKSSLLKKTSLLGQIRRKLLGCYNIHSLRSVLHG